MVSPNDVLFWLACLALVASIISIWWSNRIVQRPDSPPSRFLPGGLVVGLGIALAVIGIRLFSGVNSNLAKEGPVIAPPYWITYVALALSLIAIVSGIIAILNLKDRAKYFFLLPAALWIIGFTLFPLIYSLFLSFTNAALGKPTTFIGIDNYTRLFQDTDVAQAVSVNALILIIDLGLTLLFGTFVAWLFNH